MSITTPLPAFIETVIIGGGQAGLASGYYLLQHGRPFMILENHHRVGDNWRQRWESLQLFSPSRYDNLPGLPFPAPPGHLPRKDEVADYLETYARHFTLPIHLDTTVQTLTRHGQTYVLDTNRGVVEAQHVIVATGAYQKQRIPAFAASLDPRITQIPSNRYGTPEYIPLGDVVVVGAGNSGVQIALDIARSGQRQVWLSGRDVGYVPRRILGKDLFWWLSHTVFKIDLESGWGRRLHPFFKRTSGGVVDITNEAITQGGVTRLPRMVGVRKGQPLLADGRVLEVATVVWATGYTPDFGWTRLLVCDADGQPRHRHGLIVSEPGLYVIGLPFMYRPNSSLLGGTGADAAIVVNTLLRHLHHPSLAGTE